MEARHVSFGYMPGKTVLHDLNLKAQPGQTIAIVGHTGAGKTTLINLLMRFYDVDRGRDSGGWPRCAQGDPRVPAPGLCDGPAGHLGIWRHRL